MADVANRTPAPDAVHGDNLDGIADRPGQQLAPGSGRTLDLNPFDHLSVVVPAHTLSFE